MKRLCGSPSSRDLKKTDSDVSADVASTGPRPCTFSYDHATGPGRLREGSPSRASSSLREIRQNGAFSTEAAALLILQIAGTRAVEAISLDVPENPRDVGLAFVRSAWECIRLCIDANLEYRMETATRGHDF
jgi:hypothetical protein